MKKILLTLAFFLSFAVFSRSDPPAGYEEVYYYFNIKNWAEQYVVGATATVSDTTWIDWNGTSLIADCEGNIRIHFVYPSDPDAPISVHGLQVTFSSSGYQDCVYYLTSYKYVSIMMCSIH